jgi:hypothetical protein
MKNETSKSRVKKGGVVMIIRIFDSILALVIESDFASRTGTGLLLLSRD